MGRISPAKLLIAGAVIPAAAFAVLYRTSRRFREFVQRSNPRQVTLVQTGRVIGAAMFAQKYAQGAIPAPYGLTTAVCDVAAGVTAPLISRFGSSRALEVWNMLGLAAILVSGGSGVLTSPSRWELITRSKSSQPTTSFPLLLVPTVFGPLTLVAHLVALTVLRRSRKV
jgi:hypothetical protein